MREITDLRELQQIEKGILEKVAGFCQERGIRYSLAYGTLLGAVRHKGFIPWDDDVDVAMPRPDYERFLSEFSAEGFSLHNMDNEREFHLPFTKVFDDRTVPSDPAWTKIETSINIDIFPIDGFPNKKTVVCTVLKRWIFYILTFTRHGVSYWWKSGKKKSR